VCWQLKQREALLPILQLSALEEDGMHLQSKQESAESSAARVQMKRLLESAIRSLPVAEREVYELRDIKELGGEETAAHLNISLTAMKSRLHRARTNLRRYLDGVLATSSARR
jgi:RNA polymerase sigma-70 factor (ECF subfamily)